VAVIVMICYDLIDFYGSHVIFYHRSSLEADTLLSVELRRVLWQNLILNTFFL